ncbi:olfactory receptor 1019-like [Spea bombifrons]|uniref:olfactory receptor 1019-like n=1 Tax=Spea bombifrons TaxID=233779 RepID=UPI00234A2318|nr:olfactory receptor 1019-like [Spea bombifrons]
METMNQTMVTEFLLQGFPKLRILRTFFFFILFIFYIITVSGNLFFIWLVAFDRIFHSPMYFFLTQLALADTILITDIVPNMLSVMWDEERTIPFSLCITQFYFFADSETSECFLLAVMAYDRYVAICNPLRYTFLMNPVFCVKLVSISWLFSLCVASVDASSLVELHFCRSNVINHFFCDLIPLLELSCSDTSFIKLEILIMCIPVAFIPIIIITVSYAFIVVAVFKISNASGRWKAFNTCSSHLIVVSIYYGSLIGIYLLPGKGKSLNAKKFLSLFYTVLTPMINPIIYSLRNRDIKEAFKKMSIKWIKVL